MPVLLEQGYLIPALDHSGTRYLDCAQKLRDSILEHHPQANIKIITLDDLPFPGHVGQCNDWQMFLVSPYRETIKLEADMLATSPIDHWWSLFRLRDVVISQGCRDFYGNLSASRRYRQMIDANHLPDVYNAITYWRLSDTAREFFLTVKEIFLDWARYKTLMRYPDDEPTTDVVYAVAAEIMGRERVTLPPGLGPTIIHMKPGIGPITRDWTKELTWERHDGQYRVQTITQTGFFHYYVKDWNHQ